ncbi:ACT domain protein [bacterium BMS3Bbin06]|nr:ACT domain protein [bacterium BMS3Bbin06]HDH01440.1 ACT domain-containing protein [Nitrospirota bacterium]
MTKAKKLKQLIFSLPNRTGLLSEITAAISGAKVNITTICAYEIEDNAYFMLTTDSYAKAKRVLSKLGIENKGEDVVAVEMPNKAGQLQKVAKKIADADININYMCGTTGTGRASICLFKTSDDKKAIRVINK